jgi:hypothetical protein
VPILVGFWSMEPEEADRRDLVKSTRADMSAISFEAAIEQVLDLATDKAEAAASNGVIAAESRSDAT